MRKFFIFLSILLASHAHATDAPPVRVDISAQLIERADFEEHGLWLKLNARGAELLAQLSERHKGRVLDVYVLDEPALRAASWGGIDAGVITVATPSAKLIRKIAPYVPPQDAP